MAPLLGSTCVSHAGERVLAIANFLFGSSTFAAGAGRIKACFGVTPKPARETRALPYNVYRSNDLNILRLRLLSAVRRDRLLHTREALPR